jgi:hypothetical protein
MVSSVTQSVYIPKIGNLIGELELEAEGTGVEDLLYTLNSMNLLMLNDTSPNMQLTILRTVEQKLSFLGNPSVIRQLNMFRIIPF